MEVRRCSRLVIADADGRLLLFFYKDEHQPPFWATAGGELKPGESYTDAAARELHEETGLTRPIGKLLVSERASHLAGGYPVVRQQLGQGAGLLRRQAHEHILQVGVRIVSVQAG